MSAYGSDYEFGTGIATRCCGTGIRLIVGHGAVRIRPDTARAVAAALVRAADQIDATREDVRRLGGAS